jgi:ABC-type multidrug transport system ATPase subunit
MAIARQIGYMSQKFSLYGDLKVRENIRLYGGIYGLGNKELREKAEIAIQLADLEGRENDVTKSLPLGLKQRLALCCAILHGPKLLFLDEPTSGVDPLVRDRFWRIIFQLSRRFGMTVIVTTHYMDEAERCDRLMMMLDGRIQAIGTPDDLRDEVEEHIGKPIRINSPDPEMVTDALSGRFKRISRYGSSILAYTPDPDPDLEEIREILSGIPVNSITAEKIPFEDIFIHYAERGDENVV